MARRICLQIMAIAAALIAAVLWYWLLTGASRNQIRRSDSAVAATDAGNPVAGLAVIRASGCPACHEVPGIGSPRGMIGPSLKGYGKRQMIAGRLANSPANLTLWIEHPRTVDPDTAMPELGLTHDQARDIAAYLYAENGD